MVEIIVLNVTSRVSVIIPAYNEAQKIARCLDAPLQAQKEHFWEIIVVDDGSTDGTGNLAETMGARVIKLPENRGVAAARNAGAALAQGDFLIFLDADIVAPLETLYTLVNYLITHPDIHTAGACPGENLSTNWSSRYLRFLGQWYIRNHVRDHVQVSCFPSECGIVRRPVFEQLGGFPETHGGVGIEEFALGHALERAGFKNVLLSDVFYYTFYNSISRRCLELITRTARWAPLFLKRRRLEPVLGSGVPLAEFFSCACIAAAIALFFAGLVWQPFFLGALLAILLHAIIQLPWVWFILKNKDGNVGMALCAWPITLIMHLSIVIGFGWGLFLYFLQRIMIRKSEL